MRLKRHLLPAALMVAFAAVVVIAPHALAQFGLDEAVKNTGIPKTGSITEVIARVIRLALGFVGTLFLLLMIYAGLLWMTARGDSKKVDQAKQLITSAIIGVFIVASAYAITSLVIAAASGDTSGLQSSDSSDDSGTKLAAGAECSSGSDCASGTCSFDPGTCSNDADTFCFVDGECPGGTCEGAKKICE